MSAPTSTAVTTYRAVVFTLALGYWFYEFATTDLDTFGWQFRYLTIWGLCANVIVGWLMLRYSLGRSAKTYGSVVSASVVLNAIVVFMYWKLYFTDPTLVNGGHILPWYQEYYLHLGTQVLMMIDAFFILGVFRNIVPTFVITVALLLSYIAWIEILVKPLNSYPEGSAVSGLPYPFLNDMPYWPRMAFYGTTIGTAVVLMLVGWLISRVISRVRS